MMCVPHKVLNTKEAEAIGKPLLAKEKAGRLTDDERIELREAIVQRAANSMKPV